MFLKYCFVKSSTDVIHNSRATFSLFVMSSIKRNKDAVDNMESE